MVYPDVHPLPASSASLRLRLLLFLFLLLCFCLNVECLIPWINRRHVMEEQGRSREELIPDRTLRQQLSLSALNKDDTRHRCLDGAARDADMIR